MDSQLEQQNYAYVDADFQKYYDEWLTTFPPEMEVGVDAKYYASLLFKNSAGNTSTTFAKRTFLDLACGTGRISKFVLREAEKFSRDVHVIAVDHARAMLDAFQRSDEFQPERCELKCQSLQRLEIDKTVDVASISAGSFHHLVARAEQVECLKRIHKCLAADGRLVIERFENSDLAGTEINNDDTIVAGFKRKVLKITADDIQDQIGGDGKEFPGKLVSTTFELKHIESGASKTLCWSLRTIAKDEMEALLEYCGFKVVGVYSSFQAALDGTEWQPGQNATAWVVSKQFGEPSE